MTEFTLIDVTPPEEPEEHVTKQGLEGLSRIITELPATLGIVGAGANTTVNAQEQLRQGMLAEHRGQKPKPLREVGKLFGDTLATNLDQVEAGKATDFDPTIWMDLINATDSARGEVRGVLGIGEPRTPAEKLANLLGMFAPVPLPSKVTGPLSGAFALATPFQKFTRNASGSLVNVPNAAKAIAGPGIGIGLDQAFQAAAGQPLLFEDETISTADGTTDNMKVSAGTDNVGDDSITIGNETFSLSPRVPEAEEELVTKGKEYELIDEVDPHTREIDKELQRSQEIEEDRTVQGWATGTALIIAMLLARRKYRLESLRPSNFAPQGQGLQPERLAESASEFTHASLVDDATHIKAMARKLVDGNNDRIISDVAIDQLIDQDRTDSFGRMVNALTTGKLGNRRIPVAQEWFNKLRVFGKQRERVLFDGMLAMREKANRARATIHEMAMRSPQGSALRALSERGTSQQVQTYLANAGIASGRWTKTGLYANNFRGATGTKEAVKMQEIDRRIAALHADGELNDHATEYGKITEGALKYLVDRDIYTKEYAKGLMRNALMPDGRILFIPGKELPETYAEKFSNHMADLLNVVGVKTTVGQHIDEFSAFAKQGLKEGGGIKNPLNPGDVLNHYMYSIIQHADSSVFEWNLLQRVTGIDEAGNFIGGRAKSNDFATFLGIRELDSEEPLPKIIRKYNDSPALTKLFNLDDPLRPIEADKKITDNMIAVHRKGKQYLFYVPDKGVREAIQLSPRTLGIVNQVGRVFKNVFQGGTTRIPFFAPKAFLYATEQVWQNAIARGEKFTPKDAFRGFWEIASTNMAEELSQRLTHSIETNTGLFRHIPNQAAFQRSLKRKIETSYLTAVQREAGTLSSSIFTNEQNPSILDVMKAVAPAYKDDFSSLGLAWRSYNHILKAAYEGPAFGAMIRKLGSRADLANKTGGEIRAAATLGKDLAGDVRRRGSSFASETFHSWVPFSGAMVQSWNSIGGGLNASIKKGNYARAMTSLSIPVMGGVIAATMNSMMGEEYNDYYWNELTTEQRNNNYIFFIPGLPPEQFFSIPVSPEWTLGHAISIEMFDLFTGASTGAHYDENIPNGAHVLAAITRIFDIPVPPAMQAFFATTGKNGNTLRIGPQFQPGATSIFGDVRPLGGGERISGDRGRSRYVDPAIETSTEAFLSAILGAVGGGYSYVHNAFSTGNRESFAKGLEFGGAQLLREMEKQSSYLSPVIANIFNPSQFDEVSDIVRAKVDGIGKLKEQRVRIEAGEGTLSLDNPTQIPGNALAFGETRDPVIRIASEYIEDFNLILSQHQDEIKFRRDNIAALRGSTEWLDESLTIKSKNEHIREETRAIKLQNAKTLIWLQDVEDTINERLRRVLGRDVGFTFDDFTVRDKVSQRQSFPAPQR